MMFESKSEILKKLDMDFLVHFAYFTKLLRPRNYFTKQDFVNGLARKLNTEQCIVVFKLYKSGFEAESVAEKFLMELNSNATVIKNLFVDYLFHNIIKHPLNDIVFFEFKVGSSRTDVNRVNGNSYAFEIKSGRDKPDRAFLQTKIFSDVFDFVFLIVNDEEIYELIADNIGIIKYEYIDGEMSFNTVRRPKRNIELDSVKQLKSLSKATLAKIIDFNKTVTDKNELISEILKNFSESEINARFKNALKDEYIDKWKSYIAQHILNQGY